MACTIPNIYALVPRISVETIKVPVPFKLNAYVVQDMESDLVLIEGLDPENPGSWVPSRLICSGTASHVGKVNREKSYYTLEKLVFFLKDVFLTQKTQAKVF